MKNWKKIVLFVLVSALLVMTVGCGAGGKKADIVKDAVTKYLMDSSGDIEEVKINKVKVYTAEETADELFADYNIAENDIVFEVEYELRIAESCEDLLQFTAATGEIDGQWVREKSNVGIARYVSDGVYNITDFGTGF